MLNTVNDPNPVALRLKGNIYGGIHYFRTDVEKGVTKTPSGRRVCTLTSDFLLGFRDALIYECGKSYSQVMKTCGRRWGAQFVKQFTQDIERAYGESPRDLSLGVLATCLHDAFLSHGWGNLRIERLSRDNEPIVVTIENSILPDLVLESDQPEDGLWAGFLAAMFSSLLGRDLDGMQIDCPTQGAPRSRFVLAKAEQLADAVKHVQAVSLPEANTEMQS